MSVFYTDVTGRQTRKAMAPVHGPGHATPCPFCRRAVGFTGTPRDTSCTLVADDGDHHSCCWPCYKRLSGIEGPTALEMRATAIRFDTLMARVAELRRDRDIAQQDAINKPGEWFRPSVVPPQAAPEKVIQRVTVNLSNVLDTIRAIRAARLQ